MHVYMPLFPLNLVAFPDETLNLHIFEPRYKQMMQDILNGDRTFGVVAYVTDELDYGTEVKVDQVVRVYPDGRMDIKTTGQRIFRIQKFENPIPGKLYAGGEVEIIQQIEDGKPETRDQLIHLIQHFFDAIQAPEPLQISEDMCTFDVAHRIGLSAEQKYHLLQCSLESERQQMVIDHLEKAIPLLKNVEVTRDRIRMNGHFRHFDPLSF